MYAQICTYRCIYDPGFRVSGPPPPPLWVGIPSHGGGPSNPGPNQGGDRSTLGPWTSVKFRKFPKLGQSSKNGLPRCNLLRKTKVFGSGGNWAIFGQNARNLCFPLFFNIPNAKTFIFLMFSTIHRPQTTDHTTGGGGADHRPQTTLQG